MAIDITGTDKPRSYNSLDKLGIANGKDQLYGLTKMLTQTYIQSLYDFPLEILLVFAFYPLSSILS